MVGQIPCRPIHDGHVRPDPGGAADGANAVGRLRRMSLDEMISPEPLQELDKLFARTDAVVAHAMTR
jgi:hypothetical protein